MTTRPTTFRDAVVDKVMRNLFGDSPMSHATVLVILPYGTQDAADIDRELERAMLPFDENRDVPTRKTIEDDDLEAMRDYYEGATEEGPVRYSKMNLDWHKNLVADDRAHQWNGAIDPVATMDRVGKRIIEYTSLYNPHSKWDWYTIGGRWSGLFKLVPDPTYTVLCPAGDEGYDAFCIGDVDWELTQEGDGDFCTFAILDARDRGYPVWIENGELGWFGVSHSEQMSHEEWAAKWRSIIRDLPDGQMVVLVDYHI